MLSILFRIRFKNNWALLTILLLYSWILIHYIDVVTTYNRPQDTRLVETLFYIISVCFIIIVVKNIALLPKGPGVQHRMVTYIKKIDSRIFSLIVLMGVYVFYAIEHLGLLPASLIFCVISYPLIGEKRILCVLGITLITLAATFCLFQFWLRIPLPWGIFYDLVRQFGVY